MGSLFYDSQDDDPIDMPDRLLAHVKIVVGTKLRRGESFTLSWRHAQDQPGGRSTIWLHPSIPLRFVFESPEPEVLDPALLRELSQTATSTGGLSVALDAPVVGVDGAAGPTSAVPAA